MVRSCALVPVALILGLLLGSPRATLGETSRVAVTPERVVLEGNFVRVQLLATRPEADGKDGLRCEDLTTKAKFTSSDPAIVQATASGQLIAVGNGAATIAVAVG